MITLREKFIAIVDNDSISKSDVIVLLEGDGLNRCQKAVDLYKSGFADKILFSGGISDYSYGSFPIFDVLPQLIKLGVPESSIIIENKSLNTKEQAEYVMDLVKKYKWKKLILVATHDHQYRAYLTFLKKVLELDNPIIIFNSPARNLPWFKETGWGTRIDRLTEEFKRIEKYKKIGHLATFQNVITYQKWKELQP